MIGNNLNRWNVFFLDKENRILSAKEIDGLEKGSSEHPNDTSPDVSKLVLVKNKEKLQYGFNLFFHLWTLQQKTTFLEISHRSVEMETENYLKNKRIVDLTREILPFIELYQNDLLSENDIGFLNSIVESVPLGDQPD